MIFLMLPRFHFSLLSQKRHEQPQNQANIKSQNWREHKEYKLFNFMGKATWLNLEIWLARAFDSNKAHFGSDSTRS